MSSLDGNGGPVYALLRVRVVALTSAAPILSNSRTSCGI